VRSEAEPANDKKRFKPRPCMAGFRLQRDLRKGFRVVADAAQRAARRWRWRAPLSGGACQSDRGTAALGEAKERGGAAGGDRRISGPPQLARAAGNTSTEGHEGKGGFTTDFTDSTDKKGGEGRVAGVQGAAEAQTEDVCRRK